MNGQSLELSGMSLKPQKAELRYWWIFLLRKFRSMEQIANIGVDWTFLHTQTDFPMVQISL
jgi:hypothetical protein